MDEAERRAQKRREYQQRWLQKDPARAREIKRAAQLRWRDNHAEEIREKAREEYRLSRANNPEVRQRRYEANRERELARARERGRLQTRLRQLGLPPRRRHRVFAAEKRKNAAEADSYFQLARSRGELAKLQREAPPASVIAAHRRLRHTDSRPPLDLMERLSERARTNQERKRVARELYEEWDLRQRIPEIIRSCGTRHEHAVAEELRMDQVARKISGKPPLAADQAVDQAARRIEEIVLENDLSKTDKAIYRRIRARAEAAQEAIQAAHIRDIRSRFKESAAAQNLRQRLPRLIGHHRHRHEAGIREAIAKEQAHRARIGAHPLDEISELDKRVAAAVIATDLSPQDRWTLDQLRAAHQQSAAAEPARTGGSTWVRPHTRNGKPVKGHARNQ